MTNKDLLLREHSSLLRGVSEVIPLPAWISHNLMCLCVLVSLLLPLQL